MLLDTLNTFSADAGDDLSSTGDSTNVVDLGAAQNSAIGRELYLHVVPSVDFAGTSVALTLETDSAAAMSSATDLVTSGTLTAAQVNAGWRVRVPPGAERYLQVKWVTVSGTAGTADIFLSPSVDDTHAAS